MTIAHFAKKRLDLIEKCLFNVRDAVKTTQGEVGGGTVSLGGCWAPPSYASHFFYFLFIHRLSQRHPVDYEGSAGFR